MNGDGTVLTTRESFDNSSLNSDETAQDENGFTYAEWSLGMRTN